MDESTALRALAERILGVPYRSEPDAQPVQLLPGDLLDDLPITLPIPDGATVVGSISYPSLQNAYDHRGRRVTILFDAAMQPEDILAYYRDRLLADGWRLMQPRMTPESGFRFDRPPAREASLFCRSESGPALWVYVHAVPHALTQVHVEIDMTTRHSPCRQQGHPDAQWQPPLHIPVLRYPPDATPVAGSWGSQGSSAQAAHADAVVRTRIGLAALTTYIEEQLVTAEWKRQSGGIDGALAWSVWSVHDAQGFPWRGVLYIARRPDQEHQFMLHLTADYAGNA